MTTVKRAVNAWRNLKRRCDEVQNPSYPFYGGRGITYSDDWKVFRNFLRDMGLPPEDFSLDRIDNNGNYCKDNCRWASKKTQANNRREPRLTSAPRRDSGLQVRGVIYASAQRAFVSKGTRKGVSFHLYQGQDFFEAVCARKSWEANQ